MVIDVVYLFRHSNNADEELRYSLRSVAQNLPFIRKVWIFGDRPDFMAADTSRIEHVTQEYLTPLIGTQKVIRDDFTLLMLASLIPGLSFDFLRFADDYVVLQSLSPTTFDQPRALQDLTQVKSRGTGKWKEQLWRTHDILRRHGYTGHNFETHTPQRLTKKLVLDAYLAFRTYNRHERYGGILTETTAFNYAIRHHNQRFIWLPEESSRAGFYGKPPSPEE